MHNNTIVTEPSPVTTLVTRLPEKTVYQDILDRLATDPGSRTLGQLLQEREAARHEIAQLRREIDRQHRTGHSTRLPSATVAKPVTPVPTPEPPRSASLLRMKEVLAMVGLSRSALYQRVNEGRFPPSVPLGPRCVRWRRADVEAWIEGLGLPETPKGRR